MAKKVKLYTLSDMNDEFVGKPGTPKRYRFEYELNMEVLGYMIKKARRNDT